MKVRILILTCWVLSLANAILQGADFQQVRWYGYFVRGHQVGYSHTTYAVNRAAQGVFYYKKKYRYLLKEPQLARTIQINAVLADDFSVRSAHLLITQGQEHTSIIITTGGAITIQYASRLSTLPEQKFYLDAEDFILHLVRTRLTVGRRYYSRMLGADQQSLVSLTVVYAGRGQVHQTGRWQACHIFKVTSSEWRGFWSCVKVSLQGFLLSSECGSINISRIDQQTAQRLRQQRPPIPAPLVYDLHTLSRMELIVTNGRQYIPHDWPYQQIRDAQVTLCSVSCYPAMRLGNLNHYRQSGPHLPVHDPFIISLARRIAPVRAAARVKAQRLASWITRHLEPGHSPDGVRLRRLLGAHPQSVALATVTLARAMQIPARVISGLVYVPGAFVYRSWAELYLQGWVPVDEGHLGVTARYLALYRDKTWSQVRLAAPLGITVMALQRGRQRILMNDLKSTMQMQGERVTDLLLGISFVRPLDWALLPKNPWSDLLVLRSLTGRGPAVILKVNWPAQPVELTTLEQAQRKITQQLRHIQIKWQRRSTIQGQPACEMCLHGTAKTGRLTYYLTLFNRQQKNILVVLLAPSPVPAKILTAYRAILQSVR